MPRDRRRAQVQLARDAGALEVLAVAVNVLGQAVVARRRLRAGRVADRRGRRGHGGDRGRASPRTARWSLAALRGREAEAVAADRRHRSREATRRRPGDRRPVRALGRGGAHERPRPLRGGARRRRRQASDDTPELFVAMWSLQRADRGRRRGAATPGRARARARAARRAHARRAAREWALGIEARGARAAERGRGRRAPLPRGDRAAGRGRGCARSSPARICSTASGCAARAGASDAREQLRTAHERARRDRHGGVRRARPPRARWPRARRCAGAASRRATSSRRRRSRSPASRATGCPTRRSARGCSSARAPSSGT